MSDPQKADWHPVAAPAAAVSEKKARTFRCPARPSRLESARSVGRLIRALFLPSGCSVSSTVQSQPASLARRLFLARALLYTRLALLTAPIHPFCSSGARGEAVEVRSNLGRSEGGRDEISLISSLDRSADCLSPAVRRHLCFTRRGYSVLLLALQRH